MISVEWKIIARKNSEIDQKFIILKGYAWNDFRWMKAGTAFATKNFAEIQIWEIFATAPFFQVLSQHSLEMNTCEFYRLVCIYVLFGWI